MHQRRWSEAVLALVDDAVRRAAAGTPTTLVVEGDPGVGKSSLLDELVLRAEGFAPIRSESYDLSAPYPFAVLAQWSVASEGLTAQVAAQRLRTRVDALAEVGPVLLVIDDLQWADPESVEAVVDVMSRLDGDRLLLAVATRTDGAATHEIWQRWSSRPGRVERLRLEGLSLEDTTSLVRELRGVVDTATARALWEHTSGNPLFLGALLEEYSVAELARMQVLPAPRSFARTVASRVERLNEAGRALAEALAVLGSDWTPLPDVAAVAEVSSLALQALQAEGLVEVRVLDTSQSVRFEHTLTRSAVYQSLTLTRAKELHARAASVVHQRQSALEHRLAASDGYDDQLADDLAGFADELHAERSYRLAAHFWRAASIVTKDPGMREKRWLEALFNTLTSGDRKTVQDQLPQVAAATDVAMRGFVEGSAALFTRRPHEAVAVLAPLVEGAVLPMDDGLRYRVEILLAWSRLQSGHDPALVEAGLVRAAGLSPKDTAIRHLDALAAGTVVARSAPADELLAGIDALPANPAALPASATGALAWRGALRAGIGNFGLAADDLTELTERMQRGLADVGSGALHSLLARSQWFTGQWSLASLNLRLAVDLSGGYLHPVVAAIAAQQPISDGDLAAADTAIAACHAMLDTAPWVEAVDQLRVTEVIRQHAEGTAPGGCYAAVRDDVRAVRDGRRRKGAVWLLHAGLAAVWARELGDAETCAAALKPVAVRVSWAAATADWLYGLTAEARGQGRIALGHLRAATADGLAEVPLYRAHVLVDHARLAVLLGDPVSGARSLELATRIYSDLGARPWLVRAEALRSAAGKADQETVSLSDRERDIVTLVTSGMSYAQIARQLFITQSTVSYHLGNIYAKANVGSRHQLTALVREDPSALGLALPA